MVFFSTLLVSVLLTALTVPAISRLALRYSLVDIPDERKVHLRPTPRIGGVAMALGMVVPVVYWIGEDLFVQSFLIGAGTIALFGLLDDCRGLSPLWKFAGQLLAAGIVVLAGGVHIVSVGTLAPGLQLPTWCSYPLTMFVIVGATNAINLSDGLDGLAGGISMLSLCCIGYLGFLQDNLSVAIISLALAGATFGFLRYNTYPASIFMGDLGSQLLGFSCITLALSLTQGGTGLSPLLPLVILGFPILDTLTVMAVRIAHGRSPFAADKTHFHHALLGLGLHQTESVMTIYLIQLLLISAALLLRFSSDTLLLSGYLTFSGCVLYAFSYARCNNWQLKRIGPVGAIDAYFAQLRKTSLIRYLFRPLQWGTIALLLSTAYLSGRIPTAAAWTALGLIAVLLFIGRFQRSLLSDALRVSLYLIIPLIIHQSALRIGESNAVIPLFFYRSCFGVLAVLNILVARLTRRAHGFQSTPLDFLVVIIVLAASQLPVSGQGVYLSALIAAEVIICYFSCEVVFAELRNKLRPMNLATVALLAILVLRALV